jgi:integrase
MSVYKQGDNWYIDFTFKGKRIKKMIGPSRKTADAVIGKWKAEIAENKFLDKQKEPEPIKFYDFAKKYLELTEGDKKPSTLDREKSVMRRLDRGFGKEIMQEITKEEIDRYKVKRRKDEVKPATINRELALLKTMFAWGKFKNNPAKEVKLLDGEVERVRYLMPDEVRKLLSNCTDHLKPIVEVAVHTGMRKGELLGLRWENVNLELGIISIEKTNTKNKVRKDIPMNEIVKAAVMGIERKGHYVFCNGNGEPLKYSSVRKCFEKAVRKSKIEDFRFHDLRHTFASNLVMAGIDIITVKELMGHKDLKMTLRYSHLSPTFKAKAVNVLDQRFKKEASLSLNPHPKETDKKEDWASA